MNDSALFDTSVNDDDMKMIRVVVMTRDIGGRCAIVWETDVVLSSGFRSQVQ
jgi:hypothetical protein